MMIINNNIGMKMVIINNITDMEMIMLMIDNNAGMKTIMNTGKYVTIKMNNDDDNNNNNSVQFNSVLVY
jgi:hypothetical protein